MPDLSMASPVPLPQPLVMASDSFVFASMTVQTLYGWTSDIVGRKALYCVASAAFAALSSFTLNWEILILASALCGLGSAGLLFITVLLSECEAGLSTKILGSVVLTDAVGLANRGYYQSINYIVYGGGQLFSTSVLENVFLASVNLNQYEQQNKVYKT
ncbi:hypothetical protein MKX08_005805 [Trichoderma sp. CBMAI-0020]|nr:hypothetical protein MKX08_005805 [Trichoderma sp. CBMAI-0020]WOD46141.1 hypothetical protein [Trichoderma atroviride]